MIFRPFARDRTDILRNNPTRESNQIFNIQGVSWGKRFSAILGSEISEHYLLLLIARTYRILPLLAFKQKSREDILLWRTFGMEFNFILISVLMEVE